MPLSILNQATIQQAIAESLSSDVQIPKDHKGALVTYIDQDKAQIAIATKIKDYWAVNIVAEHDWTGDNKVGFISKVTW